MTSNIYLLIIFSLLICSNVLGQTRKFDFSADKEIPLYDPDKCWDKPILSEKYEVITEKILLKEAQVQRKYIPAKFDSIEVKELLAGSYTTCALTVPTYEEVQEEVVLREEKKSIEYVPPVYESINEETVSSPAISQWGKAEDGTILDCKQTPDHPQCEGFDVEKTLANTVPPKEEQILRRPATFKEIVVQPAIYRDIRKAVVKEAATIYLKQIPAQYDTYKQIKLVAPATYLEIKIPAEYITVTKQQIVNDFYSMPNQVEVLCKNEITPEIIRQVQEALKQMGYDVGRTIDGIFSAKTQQALFQFQKEKRLPVGNLNIWTLEELEVLDNEDDLENIEEEEEFIPPHKMF